jgi:hypothetical protein
MPEIPKFNTLDLRSINPKNDGEELIETHHRLLRDQPLPNITADCRISIRSYSRPAQPNRLLSASFPWDEAFDGVVRISPVSET